MKPNLEEVLSKKTIKTLLLTFWGSAIVLFAMAYAKYPGDGYIYVLFTVVSNLLLYFGFTKKAIFFDTFLGIFFWLGFWLKFTVRVVFSDGIFYEAVGYFDSSGSSFDHALLVSSCGLVGFLCASYFRSKSFFNYPQTIEGVTHRGLFSFYLHYRKFIWAGFVVLMVATGATNAYLGIYQRGMLTQTILPFGLNGLYKWLLLFGLASISAIIIKFEFQIRKKTYLPAMILGFLETLISNVSLFSRGMVLNGSALLYGVITALKPYSIRSSLRFFLVSGLIFSVLFIGSVYTVNYLRSMVYWDQFAVSKHLSPEATSRIEKMRRMRARMQLTQKMTTPLFIDRWVGLEGVLAISSYPDLDWSLWKDAWKEKYDENTFSFYDSIVGSSYLEIDTSKHHFISLPGVIAFFFYPGSFLFLFASMFGLGVAAAAIEVFVFHYGGKNLILCALVAQVVAFRFASFGYVPKQSYLLFGAIFLNILIIYGADKLLTRFYSKQMPATAT